MNRISLRHVPLALLLIGSLGLTACSKKEEAADNSASGGECAKCERDLASVQTRLKATAAQVKKLRAKIKAMARRR
ncbi:MAG TPA: hypothetical protein VL137_06900 [Polyangiaceae bacterium]|jgi:hypothetical protein|nr:hypothetical protein [Polyangiaceae bacterium]